MDRRTRATLLLPVFFAACLAVIIALGARTVIYPIKKEYTSIGLTAETLLQIIASVNKFLDVVAIASFGVLANAINQIKLTHRRFNGITLLDLDIKESFCNPLQAMGDVLRRYYFHRRPKLTCTAIARIIFTFATAICVWLLPVASNTLLIPKLIYHPLLSSDGWPRSTPTYLYSPRVLIDDVAWTNMSSDGRLASVIYAAFFDLKEDYREGWNDAFHFPGKYMTAYMHIEPYRVWGATVRAADIQQVFASTLKYGPPYAKVNAGFWADINVTTVSVDVRCNRTIFESAGNSGLTISNFSGNFSSPQTFSVNLSSVEPLNFSSIACNISLHQALFPVGSWTLSDTDPSGPSVTIHIDPGAGDHLYVNPYSTDGLLLQRLRQIFQKTLPELESISSLTCPSKDRDPSSYLCFLITRARRLRARQQQQQPNPHSERMDDDIPYIARILTFWAQHTLSLAQWNLSSSATEMTYSRRVHYMVYASGPRLRWQNTMLVVPCWLLFLMLAGIAFCVYFGFDAACKQRTDIWTLGHMLVAANMAPVIQTVRDMEEGNSGSARTGVTGSEQSRAQAMRQVRIYVRRDENGRQVLTDRKDLIAVDEEHVGTESSGAGENEARKRVIQQEPEDLPRDVDRPEISARKRQFVRVGGDRRTHGRPSSI